MSAVVIARNPAHRPVGILAAKSPPVNAVSRLLAGRFALRSASRPESVVEGPGAGSLHSGPHGAFSGRPRGEINGTSMCKSLQAWVASRASTFLAIPAFASKGEKALFINAIRVNERVTDGPGLAHRVLGLSAYGHGQYSNGDVQSGDPNVSPTQGKRRQAWRDRGCAPSLRVVLAGVRRGVASPRSRCWRYATRTRTAGVKAASTWWRENCLRDSSGKNR